jgi:hypothetical protein
MQGMDPWAILIVRARAVCWQFVKNPVTGTNKYKFFNVVLGIAKKVDVIRGENVLGLSNNKSAPYQGNGKRGRNDGKDLLPVKRMDISSKVRVYFYFNNELMLIAT